MPFVDASLPYLSEKYDLNIITNGFDDVQEIKLQYSGIINFFNQIITSESANSRKPSPKIFDYSLMKSCATKEYSVMIGDNPMTDVKGAYDFGMKSILYDPFGVCKSLANHTINSHMELLKVF